MAFRTRLESAIQRDIIKYLNSIENLFSYKSIATNKRGIPDITIVYNGRAIFFEVKQPGRVPRTMQEYQKWQITRAGGFFYCVTSVEDAKKALAEHDIVYPVKQSMPDDL